MRKELEREKKTIHHDKKLALSSLKCQKILFLKKVQARNKKMQYLVSVNIQLGNDDVDDRCDHSNSDNDEEEVGMTGGHEKFGPEQTKHHNENKMAAVREPSLSVHNNKTEMQETASCHHNYYNSNKRPRPRSRLNVLQLPHLPPTDNADTSLNAQVGHVIPKIMSTANESWMKTIGERSKGRSTKFRHTREKDDLRNNNNRNRNMLSRSRSVDECSNAPSVRSESNVEVEHQRFIKSLQRSRTHDLRTGHLCLSTNNKNIYRLAPLSKTIKNEQMISKNMPQRSLSNNKSIDFGPSTYDMKDQQMNSKNISQSQSSINKTNYFAHGGKGEQVDSSGAMTPTLTGYSLRLRSSTISETEMTDVSKQRMNRHTDIRISNPKSAPLIHKPKPSSHLERRRKDADHRISQLNENLERNSREKTVTMIFVEKDKDDLSPTASPFDIETWLKQTRERRGHSIVMSSSPYLTDNNDNPITEKTKNKDVPRLRRKGRTSLKVSHKPALRFTFINQQASIRARGNNWFRGFLERKRKKAKQNQNVIDSKENGRVMSVEHSSALRVSTRDKKIIPH